MNMGGGRQIWVACIGDVSITRLTGDKHKCSGKKVLICEMGGRCLVCV